MRAVILKGFGPSARLELTRLSKPTPAADELLIEVKASSLNPVDAQTKRLLAYIPGRSLFTSKLVPGHDFAGTVAAVGAAVTGFRVGDDVYGTNGLSPGAIREGLLRTGTFADFIVVKSSKVAIKPKNLSFIEAAASPLVALTALQSLRKTGLKAGQDLLVVGGSGGVGSMAVQLGKILGARVSAVCSTSNIEFVKSIGADETIDYRQSDYHDSTQKFDVVFSTTGQQGLASEQRLLKENGVILDCAAPSLSGSAELARRYAFSKGYRNEFVLYQSSGEDLTYLAGLFEAKRLKTRIATRVALADIEAGLQMMTSGHSAGKIAVANH
ncbi:NADP-dependent oxidoreductase [Allohahella sp. A8]|uniref:NADP-dependent oxidoreductase n=1 Tax=Allohahella sp. A8 TaxID=3141461 RepID=UPI003A807621